MTDRPTEMGDFAASKFANKDVSRSGDVQSKLPKGPAEPPETQGVARGGTSEGVLRQAAKTGRPAYEPPVARRLDTGQRKDHRSSNFPRGANRPL